MKVREFENGRGTFKLSVGVSEFWNIPLQNVSVSVCKSRYSYMFRERFFIFSVDLHAS